MSDGGTPPDGGASRPGWPARRWPERVRPADELSDRLNREWRLFGADGQSPSLKQRLSEPLRMALAALLGPQRVFNSTVVQHINHIHEVNDLTTHAVRQTLEDLYERTEELYDRTENLQELERYLQTTFAVERRVLDAIGALREEHAQLRTSVSVLRHETQQLSRLLAGRPVTAAAPTTSSASGETAHPSGGAQPPATATPAPGRPAHALSHKYVGFEDEFRGAADDVRKGLAAYVPLFEGASDVLDVGCGRGEFLSLLREAGIGARGIDLNEAMVEVCRERGLDATAADALTYLEALPDASLGGLFAAQVVEHLQPAYLTQFLEAAFAKLRPGGVAVLETINPACWFAFFSSYIRDITHERPLHPETLKFLLVATGFEQVEIRYSAPYPAHEKLQPVAGLPADAANVLNGNTEKLNQLLFTYLDYAAVARK